VSRVLVMATRYRKLSLTYETIRKFASETHRNQHAMRVRYPEPELLPSWLLRFTMATTSAKSLAPQFVTDS
jgi:hypothetical protein